jgi:hypothetical protein
VQNAGFDPYVVPPSAPELFSQRDDVWSHVNHPEYAAIYPPLSQLAFRGLALLGGVLVFKIAFTLLDVATIALLGLELRRRGRPAARLVLYAWNPLAVVEVAASGHLEPLGLLPLVAAVLLVHRHRNRGWGALACSMAAKYTALAALPAFLRVVPPRWGAAATALGILSATALPFVAAGPHVFDSLRAYAEHWRYNDLVFSLVHRFVTEPRVARRVVLLIGLLLCAAVAFWKVPLERRVLVALAGTLLLSPTVHPWYLLWPLVFVPLVPSRTVVAWSGTISLAYLFLFPALGRGPFPKEGWTIKLVEMTPVLAVAAWSFAGLVRRAPRLVTAS